MPLFDMLFSGQLNLMISIIVNILSNFFLILYLTGHSSRPVNMRLRADPSLICEGAAGDGDNRPDRPGNKKSEFEDLYPRFVNALSVKRNLLLFRATLTKIHLIKATV